ncbi:MAG: hypothetical protein ACD_23C01328G0001 [uncultured bacterium]|nr:MAG: hypothetical protein ACD_23C01328G0001 [uncultured bacterium]
MKINRRHMGLAQLLPDAGCSVAAHNTVVQHRNAGAANHGVELIAHHEVGQSPPQRQDDTPMAVIRMHAATAQLNHAGAQTAQPGQVKLIVAVGAPHPLRLRRGEHAIGANHLLAWHIAHQEMLTVVVKQIDIVAGQGR